MQCEWTIVFFWIVVGVFAVVAVYSVYKRLLRLTDKQRSKVLTSNANQGHGNRKLVIIGSGEAVEIITGSESI